MKIPLNRDLQLIYWINLSLSRLFFPDVPKLN